MTNPLLFFFKGGWHSAAISEEGDLYSWGWNSNGQLGLASFEAGKEKTVSVMATPHVVDIDNSSSLNVTQVACGTKHTIALLENNHLYGCGFNKYKQIKSEDREDYNEFTFIRDFSQENVDRILCGPWNSALIVDS
ncbi:hypothetical protein HUJ04_001992 [Dendroctonus ponderosae]|nr:hypothetical protein HUJ04_001992 [Dendroctonus ponderosae]